MSIYLIVIATLALFAVGYWQGVRANAKRAEKKISALTQQMERALQATAVAKAQLTNQKTRSKNEQNTRYAERMSVIERLQQAGDTRD